jgi:hypothetical protein
MKLATYPVFAKSEWRMLLHNGVFCKAASQDGACNISTIVPYIDPLSHLLYDKKMKVIQNPMLFVMFRINSYHKILFVTYAFQDPPLCSSTE